jgi:hypothetical protein
MGVKEDRGYSGQVAPVARLSKKPRVCCLLRVIFADLSPLISKACNSQKLEIEDVWAVDTTALDSYNEFMMHWAEEQSMAQCDSQFRGRYIGAVSPDADQSDHQDSGVQKAWHMR